MVPSVRWCALTLFGWVFLCAFWLLVVWFLAWGLSSLTLSIANIERIACALGVGMPELLTEPERAQRKSGSKA